MPHELEESESLDRGFSGCRSSSPRVLELPVPGVVYLVSLKPSTRVIPCQINTKFTTKQWRFHKSLLSFHPHRYCSATKMTSTFVIHTPEIPTTIQGDLPRGTHPDYLYSIYLHTKFTYLYININIKVCVHIVWRYRERVKGMISHFRGATLRRGSNAANQTWKDRILMISVRRRAKYLVLPWVKETSAGSLRTAHSSDSKWWHSFQKPALFDKEKGFYIFMARKQKIWELKKSTPLQIFSINPNWMGKNVLLNF